MEKNEKGGIKTVDEISFAAANYDEEPEKINYRGIKSMPFIIGNETFEKLGAIGTSSNLQLYLATVFNMTHFSATMVLNVFNGTTNIATLVGAYLCDTYFGRYKTLGVASIASLFGFMALTLTAVFKNLHPPHCSPGDKCVGPDVWQMAFLLFSFGLMIIGAGGIRPCNLAFGVDQFNPNTESGKRGIASFFNCPMTSLVQVAVAAAKKRRLELPEQLWLSLFNYKPPKSINSRLPYTEQFIFLDKAAIITAEDEIKPDGSASNPWCLCTTQQVEELKCVLRVIPVSLTAIFYHIGVQQQYVVFQALQSDRHLGSFQIPAASYIVFAMLSLTLWVPLYDRVIVPFLRRLTKQEGGITILQRMGIGIFLTILGSLVGAAVEERRRSLVRPASGPVSAMSAMWLVPQLTLSGFAEAFNAIGQIEFYYKQFPENMRSVGGAFYFCGSAASHYVYSLLISVVHRMTEDDRSGSWLPEDLNKGRYKGDGDSGVEMEMKKPGNHSAWKMESLQKPPFSENLC
ncbi:hypothetical protein ABFS83_04G162100 [Erythranthe nasuta]